jgi:hypothetical protein
MSPSSSEGNRWALVPAPKRDELLSAWLCRCAGAHGQSLHRFAFEHLRARALPYRDVDAFPPDSLLEAIEQGSGLDGSVVRSMTLLSYREHLKSSAGKPEALGSLLPLTHTARAKFRYGQQACVQCLVEGRGYRRAWRLPFVVACDLHDAWLIDACPACDAPLDPRQNTDLRPTCAYCYVDWGVRSTREGPFFSGAFQVQQWLLQAIEGSGVIEIDRASVPLSDALRGFAFLLRLDRRLGRAEATPQEHAPLRIAQRIRLLQRLSELLAAWPQPVLADCARLDLPRNPFGGEDCPAWVLGALSGLREVRSHVRRPCEEDDPVLAKLRLRQPANWRSRYAHRLVRLAGRPRGR